MLRNIKTRLISLLLISTFLISVCGIMPCDVRAKEGIISTEYAKKIAVLHIQSFIANNEKDELSKWEWGVYIEEPVPMYSPDGYIEAYYIDVVDKEKTSVGYVIVGANKTHPPIIEYGICNEFYPAVMAKVLEADTFYYLGSVFYLIGNEKAVWDVSGFGSYNQIDKENLKNVKVICDNYAESWIYWEKAVNDFKVSIEDGRVNESSYTVRIFNRPRQNDVNGYNQPYTIMDAFPGEVFHCFPVASVNLFIYWTRYGGSHYSVLRQPNDRQWRHTFNILKEYENTIEVEGPEGGTKAEDGANGLNRYIRECGLHNFTQSIGNPDKFMCMDEIDDGRPYIIDYEHPQVSRHAMLVLGYRNESTFSFRVVDGFSGYAGRFFTIDDMYGIVTIEIY
jgi:hypothetical protein